MVLTTAGGWDSEKSLYYSSDDEINNRIHNNILIAIRHVNLISALMGGIRWAAQIETETVNRTKEDLNK